MIASVAPSQRGERESGGSGGDLGSVTPGRQRVDVPEGRHPRDGIGVGVERRTGQRRLGPVDPLRSEVGAPGAADHLVQEPAPQDRCRPSVGGAGDENEPVHALGVGEGDVLGDQAAHRVPGEAGPVDAERVHEGDDVLRHRRDGEGRRVRWPRRLPMPAEVHSHDPQAGHPLGEVGHNLRPRVSVVRQPVQEEQHRTIRRAHARVGHLDSRGELRFGHCSSGGCGCVPAVRRHGPTIVVEATSPVCGRGGGLAW